MENKERLDTLIFSKKLTKSREQAKQLILNNCVFIDEVSMNKPSTNVSINSNIIIKNDNNNYVSRGAFKLEKAINFFNINLSDFIAIDIGASTGGFTDYLLQHGVRKVYAIDVGHDQLDDKLKNNEKIINIENTNFRYINSEIFKESVDIIVVDVSFISLSLILPKIVELCHENTYIITLIKPQFEAGKNNIGKNGIVRDKKIHHFVLNNFNDYSYSNSLFIENITFSPIKGGNGNIEYLCLLKKGNKTSLNSDKFKNLINEAFEIL